MVTQERSFTPTSSLHAAFPAYLFRGFRASLRLFLTIIVERLAFTTCLLSPRSQFCCVADFCHTWLTHNCGFPFAADISFAVQLWFMYFPRLFSTRPQRRLQDFETRVEFDNNEHQRIWLHFFFCWLFAFVLPSGSFRLRQCEFH
ncbi:hypothetical protein EDB84DRAFT_1481511 [Lactarius hengduanensis]|nr:hypothetical protein EDB84DRAFT_1481511 [Lactarius hengduanensis]